MPRVLVVGGGGYVGSVLTEELLQRGYAVRVLDRLYFGDAGLRAVRDRIELVEADMRAVPAGVLDGVDAVVNVGGLSNDPTAEYNPRANHEMNTVATAMLARLCKAAGVRRYVLASSCSIYDCGVLNEGADVLQDETSPVAPRAPYSLSKHDAEREILPMADERFCPVALRKGTVYGYSPRMRYDLVVNTFVRDALTKGRLTLHQGGEMWRPLVDVRDAAQAYIALVEAEDAAVRGEVFNLCYRNLRISELALRVQEALRRLGIDVDVRPDYQHGSVRNYRVSGEKIGRVLNFRPKVSIEESVADMVQRIRADGRTDFDHARYYNIRWLQLLEDHRKAAGTPGSVLDAP
ncbi:MAG TPA: SDR family oxidoreductase [Methylomirabilota bacterium]|jgi:nucleoside-diphosphate-sugar epimerase